MPHKYLAFDLGASSGRAMLGTLEGDMLRLEEIHRFENKPVMMGGTLYWDLPGLFDNMLEGLKKAAGRDIESIGIDTWGVDFALLDSKGSVIGNPVHYRDSRTKGMMDKLCADAGKGMIYEETGLAFMELNTLYQLYSMAQNRDPALDIAQNLLFMPDLLAYLLTGSMGTEYTIASTSQMLNAHTGDWSERVIEAAGIPRRILGKIESPGTIRGRLTGDVRELTGMGDTPVVAVAGHDTASAVAAVPAAGRDFMYISSGTWSLVGGEAAKPVINDKAFEANFTNEGGIGGSLRVLKNVMGLWIIQELRREWAEQDENYSFDDLERLAGEAEPFAAFIDPDDGAFFQPGRMRERLLERIADSGQKAPAGAGGLIRTVYESLAMKYRYCVECYSEFSGNDVGALHIVGGGSADGFLNQMTANALNFAVYAGPREATAIGNLLTQAAALGHVEGLAGMRAVVAKSFAVKRVEPDGRCAAWDAAYARFRNIIGI